MKKPLCCRLLIHHEHRLPCRHKALSRLRAAKTSWCTNFSILILLNNCLSHAAEKCCEGFKGEVRWLYSDSPRKQKLHGVFIQLTCSEAAAAVQGASMKFSVLPKDNDRGENRTSNLRITGCFNSNWAHLSANKQDNVAFPTCVNKILKLSWLQKHFYLKHNDSEVLEQPWDEIVLPFTLLGE